MATIQLEEMTVAGDPGSRIDDEEERRRERERLEAEQRAEEEREARREALRDLSGFPEAGTSARVMEDVERDQRQVGTDDHRGVILSGPTRGTAPMPAADRERVQAVEQRLQSGDTAGVDRDTRREQRGTPSAESLSAPQPASPMAREAVTAARPAPMRQEAVGTGSDPGIRARTGALLEESRGVPMAPPAQRASLPVEAAKQASAPQSQGRLDEGLPSEADIGGARDVDTFRRILHAIGNGLLGYSGRAPQQFRSNADALQQRRDAGLRERMGQKREDVQRQDAMGLRTAQMDAQREDRAAARQVQDSQLDIQRRRLGLSERQIESEEAESTRTREADAQLDLVDSSASQRERAALAVRLSQISPEQRREALAQIGGSEGLTGLTGREAAAIRAELARPVQPRGTALRGPGMGRGQRDESITSLRAAAREAGIPDAVASSATPAELRRELIARSRPQRGRGPGADASGVPPGRRPMLPGVTVDEGLVDDTTYRRHHEGLIAGRRAGDALRQIRDVASRYGASAIIDPRAGAELAAPLQRMLTRVSQMRSSGVIQPGELPTIQAFVPDPTSGRQITIGEFNGRMASFLRDIDEDVVATLEADGASQDEIQTALAYIHGEMGGGGSGGAARQADPAAAAVRDSQGNVVMYSPDGPRRVPPGMVEARARMGWTYEPGAR